MAVGWATARAADSRLARAAASRLFFSAAVSKTNRFLRAIFFKLHSLQGSVSPYVRWPVDMPNSYVVLSVHLD
jgi:hypothetical protein